MKILILLSIMWTDSISVLKWIVLYFMLVTTLCNNANGICWSHSLNMNREVNVERLVSPRVNPCRWIDDCTIECLQGGSSYSSSIQSVYDDHIQCILTGVKLVLPSDANSDLNPNWFWANIKIVELEMDLSNIHRISENPFESIVFSTVKTLILKNLYPCELRKFTFHGLFSLENLIFADVKFEELHHIQIDVLEFVKPTLKTFNLIESNQKNKAISVDNFIGGNSLFLSNMEYVKIKYNLSSIYHLSFTAIPNVKKLELSDCQISVIGPSTFQSLGDNLELLNLERNMLITLPVGIFTHLHLISTVSDEIFLKIRLSGNPFDCDCHIQHLKYLLGNYSNFDGDVLCYTPERIINYPIGTSEFCPEIKLTTTLPTTTTTTLPTTTITLPITTITLPTTTITFPTTTITLPTTITTLPQTEDSTDNNTSLPNGTTDFVPHYIENECFSSNGSEAKEKIFIKSRIYQMRVTVTCDEVSVSIQNNEPDVALIWFRSDKIPNDLPEYQQSPIIDCATNLPKNIVMKNLDPETAYTLCLINVVDTSISPLNCISYYHRGVEINGVWLLGSSKPLVISLIVGVLIVSIIVGVMIGAIYLKYNQYDPFRIGLLCSNNNRAPIIQETINSNVVNIHFNDREKVTGEFSVNGKQRYMSGFGCNSIFTTELGSLDIPPPLPPHPKYLEFEKDDDNYYATVKYKD